MQNQMPYIPFQSKMQSPTATKIIDRSIPNIPLRHATSNPNISLDIHSKTQFEGFRNGPITQPQVNQYNRARHGDLARSMILPQQ